MERLLVTGVDTAVGSNLALRLADRFDVLGLYDRQAIESAYLRTAAAKQGRAAVEDLLREWKPAWVIHCTALSAGSWDDVPMDALTEDAARTAQWLSMLTAKLPARLTVISSDVVYAGPRMFHEEACEPTGASPWAQAVLAVERALQGTQALIVRTHAYGWSPAGGIPGFAERAHASLSGGVVVPADGLRHATPILATDLADLLARAYELRLQGLYHLAGAERTSPFRFVRELAAASGLSAGCRWAADPAEAVAAAHLETSLNSKRARRALQCATPLQRDGLNRFAEQACNGWRDRWRTADRSAARQLVA